MLLLVGESGTGKTTIAELLEKDYGLKQVRSFSNRPQRNTNDTSHTFITDQNVEKIKKQYPNRVAEGVFDGHFYFATQEQVEECDVYVISPDAIAGFKERYKGKKTVKVIYLKVGEFMRRIRMERRGDSPEDIERRIQHDKIAFSGAELVADAIVYNYVASETIGEIMSMITEWKKGAVKQRGKK